jgi:threonine dehydrogenase-like Zn-dependent dehydrogenase
MKALCWHGSGDVRVDTVPDPRIQHPRDAIIKITASGICGSDLHLFDGFIPTMEKGDILGHEPMGVVVEVGKEVTNLKKGDRVVVPFTISCGNCYFCNKTLFSCCDNSNPNAEIARKAMGHSPAGLFGFSHMFGGFAGGHRCEKKLRQRSSQVQRYYCACADRRSETRRNETCDRIAAAVVETKREQIETLVLR